MKQWAAHHLNKSSQILHFPVFKILIRTKRSHYYFSEFVHHKIWSSIFYLFFFYLEDYDK
jgi:hypothetical protein